METKNGIYYKMDYMGFRVQGLGLGFSVQGLGSGFRVGCSSGFRAEGWI